ncbi:MAG: hypothetical protein ACLFQK_11045 [Fibrobacterota bacterium]
MKEYVKREVELGYLRPAADIIDDMERISAEMEKKGWAFSESRADTLMKKILLLYERDI